MITCSSGSFCTFAHGLTQAGEEILICHWHDIASLVQRRGRWLRAYCPVHESDHQRSLSINAENGWGHCFRCQARVLVQELNPQVAMCLLQRVREAPAALPLVPPARLLPSQSQPEPSSHEGWQAEEGQMLSDLHEQGALRLDRNAAWNAQAYLAARHIPLELALATGVGYLESGASQRYRHRLLQRWEDRLIFPLTASCQPQRMLTKGFAGRLLWQWHCCQDEIAHKDWLEHHERTRWLKTNPAGWFWQPQSLPASDPVIVVEGPFDRLAVLAAGGFHPEEVVALVGTAIQPQWLATARAVLLALDDDYGGREASKRIERHLAWGHTVVESCQPPSDGSGTDWSERYRRGGAHGLEVLYARQALLAHGL